MFFPIGLPACDPFLFSIYDADFLRCEPPAKFPDPEFVCVKRSIFWMRNTDWLTGDFFHATPPLIKNSNGQSIIPKILLAIHGVT